MKRNNKQRNKVNAKKINIKSMTLNELANEVGTIDDLNELMIEQVLQKDSEAEVNAANIEKEAERLTDKVAYVMLALNSNLRRLENNNYRDAEEKSIIQRMIKNAQNLLKGINKEFYYNETVNGKITRRILHLKTSDLQMGRSTDYVSKSAQDKMEKLKKLEEIFKARKIDPRYLLCADGYYNYFTKPVCKEEFGKFFVQTVDYFAKNNTDLREIAQDTSELIKGKRERTQEDILRLMNFANIMSKNLYETIKENINEIDIDSLLLLLAYKCMEGVDSDSTIEKENKDIEASLIALAEVLPKNSKITMKNGEETIRYSYDDLVADTQRFYDGLYIHQEEIDLLKECIIDGTINVDKIDLRSIKIVNLSATDLIRIKEGNPFGYKFIISNGSLISQEQIEKLSQILPDEDVIELYKMAKFPIDNIKAKKNIIMELLNRRILIPSDIIKLYREKLISLKDLEKVIRSIEDVNERYSYIYGNFGAEDELFNILIQNLNIESETINNKGEKRKKRIHPDNDDTTKKTKNAIPSRLRWKMMNKIGEDFRFEPFKDGHVAFIFEKQNKVIIERMLKVTNGKNEDSYGEATYAMTLDEYKKYKDEFVDINGEYIDRPKLIDARKNIRI